MGRYGDLGWLAVLAAGLVASGCYTWRGTSADHTLWDELPNDPRPELWIEGSPKVAVAFEGVYTALGDAAPVADERSTEHYRRVLREAHVFSELGNPAREPPGLCRVRLERRFREDENTAANFSKALTVPGLLGYRFGLLATFRLELACPERAPVGYEARSVLTRIYHHAERRDEARRIAYYEAEEANSQAILHQLRADGDLFDVGAALDQLAPL